MSLAVSEVLFLTAHEKPQEGLKFSSVQVISHFE